MDKNKRRSLTIRLQPSDGKLLAEIVDWFNQFSNVEKKRRAADVFLMTLLPYAREAAGGSQEEIERCYWEAADRLNQYTYVMRQALCISSSIGGASATGSEQERESELDRAAIDRETRTVTEAKKQNSQRVTLRDIDEMFGI